MAVSLVCFAAHCVEICGCRNASNGRASITAARRRRALKFVFAGDEGLPGSVLGKVQAFPL
jgi:hypothetical protein